jgi:cytochrome P450
MRRYPLPPGPPGRFLLGSFPLGRRDPLSVLTEWAKTYGDIFFYRAFTTPVYFLNHPDLIASVLVTNSRNFVKGRGLQVNERLFGKGLLTSEGELWLSQRRLCQPAFHSDCVKAYGATMVEYAEKALAQWRDGEERDLELEMRQLTLKIVAKALFGADISPSVSSLLRAARPITEFNTRGRALLPLMRYLPTPLNLRYRKAVRRLERFAQFVIREGSRNGKHTGGLLCLLLDSRGPDGSALTVRQLRDQTITFLLAGHETTALALCWTFYLLAQNPFAEEKLLAELSAAAGERPLEAVDLPRLPYAEKVIRESLRLYPPAFAVARMALQDCEIGRYRVPKGASVVMSQWVIHRDPRFFDSPEQFQPERWSEDFVNRLPKFAYFPFGGGPRLCIGSSFALTEAMLLLLTILRRFHVSLAPGCAVQPVTAITLRPANGMRVILTRRALPPGSCRSQPA